MATVDQIADAVVDAVLAALNSADVQVPPGQVGVGWPWGPGISDILGQNEAQITVYPLSNAAQNRTSRKPAWKTYSQPTVPLLVAATTSGSNQMLTFSGASASGLNIHTFVQSVGGPLVDCYCATGGSDTLGSIATKVAAAVNAAGVAGVSATTSGNSTIVSGSPTIKCNIGGQGTIAREVRRTMLPVQVSVWAANGPARNQLGQVLENSLALDVVPFLNAIDGSAIRFRQRAAPKWVDESESSYSLYEWHCVYECEYPTLQTAATATVLSVGLNLGAGATVYTGG